MNAIVLEDVLQRVHKLPSLPTVVIDLLASLNQDDLKIDVLTKKIGKDQALTARILRLANSSFYGMKHRITSIQSAVAILGFKMVRSLATTAALMGSMTAGTRSNLPITPFWRHAIGTAVCARELASYLGLDSDVAYAAGLLHDIGRLVLVTQFQAPYESTMSYRSEHDCRLLHAEQAVLGVDHAQVGQALTQHWKFPESIQQAVAAHHLSSCAGLQPLSVVIMAANSIAHALDMSQDEDDLVTPVPAGLWEQLGLDDGALLVVLKNAENRFASESEILTS